MELVKEAKMGIWSVPWESTDKAKVFASRMGSDWIAEVQLESGDSIVELEGIGNMFWEDECLFGSDDLVDLLSERAQELQSDFDIRESVIKSLREPLREMELQLQNPQNLEAVNLVRVAVGIEPLPEAKNGEDCYCLSVETEHEANVEFDFRCFKSVLKTSEERPKLYKVFYTA